MLTTIGRYIEEQTEAGTMPNNQVCVYIDHNNNIKWIGKAEFAPLYLNWARLDRVEIVGQEARFYEVRADQQRPAEDQKPKRQRRKYFIYFLVGNMESKNEIEKTEAHPAAADITAAEKITFSYNLKAGEENVYIYIEAYSHDAKESRTLGCITIKNHTGRIDNKVIQVLTEIDNKIYDVKELYSK